MPNIDKRKTKETDKARTNLLKSLLNVDNQSMLLHKRELSNYIKYSNNSLIAVEVDLTLSCNHRCPSCTFSHNRNAAAYISDDLLDKLVQGLPKLGVNGMIITGGGEP